MPIPIREATATTAATPVDGKPGRFLIQLITPGWGSSGYYSQPVLEAAGANKVFPKGMHMYLDHPTRTEEYDRPERTIRDLAAVLAEDARWDAGLKALVAEARVFGEFKAPLEDMADDIGTSIRAYAEGEPGEVEGRHGQVFSALVEGISCDFVTHAGRGGKILQVIESARTKLAESVSDKPWSDFSQSDYTIAQWRKACLVKPAESTDVFGDYKLPVREPSGTLNRNGCHAAAGVLAGSRGGVKATAEQKRSAAKTLVGLYRNQLSETPPDSLLTAAGMATAEASVNDTRDMLDAILTETYGTDTLYVYVCDFDPEAGTVWFRQRGPDVDAMYAQNYTIDGTSVTLDGAPQEVQPVTTYVPIDPVGQPTTTESEEDTMPNITIDEAAHTALVERAGRVQAIEAERDAAVTRATTAETERDTARAELASVQRGRTVARIMRESLAVEAHQGVELDEYQRAGIAARAVMAQDGTVDETATRTAFDTAIAKLAESDGTARVRGLGGPVGGGKASESDVDPLELIDDIAAEAFLDGPAFDLEEV